MPLPSRSDIEHLGRIVNRATGEVVGVADVCRYRSHAEHYKPHPQTGRVICWVCHPPAQLVISEWLSNPYPKDPELVRAAVGLAVAFRDE